MLLEGLLALALVIAAAPGIPPHGGPRPVDADIFGSAMALFRRGDHAAARPLFEKAVAKNPDAAHLHLYLAFCRTRSNDRRAFESYRRAADLAPKDPEMSYQLGLALLDDGRPADAAAPLETAVKMRPDWTDARIAWAEALEGKGAADASRAEFDRAVRMEPEDVKPVLARGQAHLRRNRLVHALGDMHEAVRRAPADAAARLWLGAALGLSGKRTMAVEEIAQALSLDSQVIESTEADGLPAQTAPLIDEARGTQAPTSNATGTAAMPKKPAAPLRAKIQAARPTAKAGGPTPAPSPAPTPSRETASELASLIRVGTSAQDAGEHGEAVESFRRAVALDASSAAAQLGLGIALHSKTEREASNAALTRAVELDPKSAAARYYLGANAADSGEHDRAIGSYREALRLDPTHLQALVGLGISLSEKGLHEEAMASYREAIAKDANYAEAHYHLAVSLSSEDHDPEAIASLKEAIRIDPQYADPHYTLGVIYHNMNKSTEALKEYQLLKDLDEHLAHELYRTIYPE